MRRSLTQSRVPKTRAGFTLVELLVVIAIIGILVSMLLPVATSALETAREGNCKSNMKQVATAMAAHEADYKTYPVGADPLTGHTGLNHLLQYLGHQNLFDSFKDIGFDQVLTDSFGQLTAAEVKIYACASDPAADGGVYEVDSNIFSRSNIVMCFGSDNWGTDNANQKGIWRLGARSSSSYASKDGSTNTASLSEVAADPADGIDGMWIAAAGGASGYTHSTTPSTGVVGGYTLPSWGDEAALDGETGQASSNHRGLVNVAYVDTHVDRVDENVALSVWEAMGTSQGGEIIMGDTTYDPDAEGGSPDP